MKYFKVSLIFSYLRKKVIFTTSDLGLIETMDITLLLSSEVMLYTHSMSYPPSRLIYVGKY